MDNELLVKNIIRLSEDRKLYPTNACIEAGVGKSFISTLRRGVMPSVDKVQKLSDFFGVTTSELLGEKIPPVSELDTSGEDILAGFDAETREAIELLKQLHPENLDKAKEYIRFELEKQAKNRGNQ